MGRITLKRKTTRKNRKSKIKNCPTCGKFMKKK